MTILWTIVTFAFTFGTLGVIGYAIVRAFTRSAEDHVEAPTVDSGWRAT